jgi:hypothetical protein
MVSTCPINVVARKEEDIRVLPVIMGTLAQEEGEVEVPVIVVVEEVRPNQMLTMTTPKKVDNRKMEMTFLRSRRDERMTIKRKLAITTDEIELRKRHLVE